MNVVRLIGSYDSRWSILLHCAGSAILNMYTGAGDAKALLNVGPMPHRAPFALPAAPKDKKWFAAQPPGVR